eukprot:Colp12_sorted_trinity150504_noHs@30605
MALFSSILHHQRSAYYSPYKVETRASTPPPSVVSSFDLPGISSTPYGISPFTGLTVSKETVQKIRDLAPNEAWAAISAKQTVNPVRPLSLKSPKQEGYIRFVCISDTHTKTDQLRVPDGDVLLHAGDFTQEGKQKDVEAFNEWLGKLPHKHKIVIAGNHDISFDEGAYPNLWRRFGHKTMADPKKLKASLTNCTYLEDSGCIVEGYRIWGSPWQPEFFSWGFNLPRGEQLKQKWDLIPNNTDILLTHSPPMGYCDLTDTQERTGCLDLLEAVQNRIKPLYHIFGHIHEAYGMTTNGQTVFINAATCTLGYKPINMPIIFDLPIRTSPAESIPRSISSRRGTESDLALGGRYSDHNAEISKSDHDREVVSKSRSGSASEQPNGNVESGSNGVSCELTIGYITKATR